MAETSFTMVPCRRCGEMTLLVTPIVPVCSRCTKAARDRLLYAQYSHAAPPDSAAPSETSEAPQERDDG